MWSELGFPRFQLQWLMLIDDSSIASLSAGQFWNYHLVNLLEGLRGRFHPRQVEFRVFPKFIFAIRIRLVQYRRYDNLQTDIWKSVYSTYKHSSMFLWIHLSGSLHRGDLFTHKVAIYAILSWYYDILQN